MKFPLSLLTRSGGGIVLRHRWLFFVLLLGFLLLIPLSRAEAQEPGGDLSPLPPVPQRDPFFGIVQAIHDPDKAVAAGVGWERLVVWWSQFQPEGPTDWVPDAWFARNLIEDQKNRGIEPISA